MSSKEGSMKTAPEALAFIDLIAAAMEDAAVEQKITQLKAQLTPLRTGRMTQVRIVVMPELMDLEKREPLKRVSCPKCSGVGNIKGAKCPQCNGMGTYIV